MNIANAKKLAAPDPRLTHPNVMTNARHVLSSRTKPVDDRVNTGVSATPSDRTASTT
jgi:hypothetical protein